LTRLFIQGIDKYVVEDVEEARQWKEEFPRPLHIIEGPLMSVRLNMFEYFIPVFHVV